MPRKGYKSLTVKDEAFYKFVKALKEAKKVNPRMDNSKFINSLIDLHKKSKQI